MTEDFLGVCHAIEARGWKGDKQVLLVFTSERMIVMRKGWLSDIAGSGVGFVVGGLILGGALTAADSASQKKEMEKAVKEDFDQLIEKHKGSYATAYSDIESAGMYKTFAESWLEMLNRTGKHRFKRIMGVKDRKEFLGYEGVAKLLENKISDRLKLGSRI